MTTQSIPRATHFDLYRVEGRAELINGKVVAYPLAGFLPGGISANISFSLHGYCKSTKRGHAYTATLIYAVPLMPSGRESFSPFASYYDGPLPADRMSWIQGPPKFAVEVRLEGGFGSAADRAMSEKRDDYFAAGTLVVWDVDPLAEAIAKYTRDAPTQPKIFKRGDIADAEPAVSGWSISVDEVFDV